MIRFPDAALAQSNQSFSRVDEIPLHLTPTRRTIAQISWHLLATARAEAIAGQLPAAALTIRLARGVGVAARGTNAGGGGGRPAAVPAIRRIGRRSPPTISARLSACQRPGAALAVDFARDVMAAAFGAGQCGRRRGRDDRRDGDRRRSRPGRQALQYGLQVGHIGHRPAAELRQFFDYARVSSNYTSALPRWRSNQATKSAQLISSVSSSLVLSWRWRCGMLSP
jgi:hypothetical protein